jgi:hypothetical protein
LGRSDALGGVPSQALADEGQGIAGTVGNDSGQWQLGILWNADAPLGCLFEPLRPAGAGRTED